MATVKNKDLGKVQLMEPYLADDLSVVYVTFTKYFSLDGKDGVAAVDINLQWPIYKEVIDDMDFLSHYYIVDKQGNSLIHSEVDPSFLRGLFEISEVEFNVDENGIITDLSENNNCINTNSEYYAEC